jgi:hypothetical protein
MQRGWLVNAAGTACPGVHGGKGGRQLERRAMCAAHDGGGSDVLGGQGVGFLVHVRSYMPCSCMSSIRRGWLVTWMGRQQTA